MTDTRPPSLLATTLLSSLERAINTALQADPLTLHKLGDYCGNLVELQLTVPPLHLFVLILEDGVEIYSRSEASSNVRVSGGPVDLAGMFFNWHSASSPVAGNVQIEGDRELLQALVALGRNLNIAWGELLGPLLGRDLAQSMEYGARRLFVVAEQLLKNLQQNSAQYFQQPNPYTPAKRELFEFSQDVAELRADVDRLSARIRLLQTPPGDSP